jgi:hypothetical protein
VDRSAVPQKNAPKKHRPRISRSWYWIIATLALRAALGISQLTALSWAARSSEQLGWFAIAFSLGAVLGI